jgi:hypothetical protein
MAKRPSLSASFVVGEQPILDPTPQPQAIPQVQTLGLPTPKARDLIARVRGLSRELVAEHGRAGNSIEALVTEAMQAILAKHSR